MSDSPEIECLPDASARLAALTDHDRTLLVEAGAGSGKTALMAGRVALLVAEGCGSHFERRYVYFAMAFSLLIELLNRRRSKHAPQD